MLEPRPVRGRAMLALLALLASTRPAFAGDEPSTEGKPPAENETPSEANTPQPSGEADAPSPSAGERALATGAAVVPGVLVHGMGHYVAGETTTGHRLLIAQGVGFGLVLGGGGARGGAHRGGSAGAERASQGRGESGGG